MSSTRSPSYDTHDTGAENEPLTEVEPRGETSVVVSFRLDRESLRRLRELAEDDECRPPTLVKRWVLERLAEEGEIVDDETTKLRSTLLHRVSVAVDQALRDTRRAS